MPLASGIKETSSWVPSPVRRSDLGHHLDIFDHKQDLPSTEAPEIQLLEMYPDKVVCALYSVG